MSEWDTGYISEEERRFMREQWDYAKEAMKEQYTSMKDAWMNKMHWGTGTNAKSQEEAWAYIQMVNEQKQKHEEEEKILAMFPITYGVDYVHVREKTPFDDQYMYKSTYDGCCFDTMTELIQHIRPFRLEKARLIMDESGKVKEELNKEINDLKNSLGL